jgi:hypothetical protein
MTTVLTNDFVRRACEDAVTSFGGQDGIFNSAGFGVAFRKLAGVTQTLDGKYVRAILLGRKDVDLLSGGAHFRLLR